MTREDMTSQHNFFFTFPVIFTKVVLSGLPSSKTECVNTQFFLFINNAG